MGRGKVGDVVFSRVGGQQVARARNRAPKNPQTNLQVLQRIMFATVGRAYSLVSDIADHSFEGLQVGTPNQSRFIAMNVAKLRGKLSSVLSLPTDEIISSAAITNFNQAGDPYAELNDYVISSGSLPPVSVVGVDESGTITAQLGGAITATDAAAPTYAEIANALGMQLGDQLTVCALVHNYRDFAFAGRAFASQFIYARVILAPADGNTNGAFLDGAAVSSPNERNLGTVSFAVTNGTLRVSAVNGVPVGYSAAAGARDNVVFMAAIASRQSQSGWLRSSQSFVNLVEGDSDLSADTIADAYQSYLSANQSGLYLNQASRGIAFHDTITPRAGYVDVYVDAEGTQRPIAGRSYSELYVAIPSDWDGTQLTWYRTSQTQTSLYLSSTNMYLQVPGPSQLVHSNAVTAGSVYKVVQRAEQAAFAWLGDTTSFALEDGEEDGGTVRP